MPCANTCTDLLRKGDVPIPRFSQAIVHSGAFRAGGALIVDSRDSKGNIQDQIDDAMAFVQNNIHCALVITPGKVDHDPVWDYPLDALRETLANAICHRDYGAPYDIQVKVFEDSLRISSPGQLPFDMRWNFSWILRIRRGRETR